LAVISAFLLLQAQVALLNGADKKRPEEKVGGGLNFFSTQQEVAMGQSYSDELNRQLDLVSDPAVVQYVEGIGNELVKRSLRQDIQYRFFVVNTNEVNAFAVPGGFVYVNRGLMQKADNESELAGVLGHEIGHVVGRHSLKQMSKKLLLSGITIGAGMAVGAKSKKWGQVAQLIGGVGVFFASLKYSRDDERQADWLGLKEMSEAGYDPQGMVTFFEKLDKMGKERGGQMPAFLSTHPLPAERLANMQRQIAELGLTAGRATANEQGFRDCRARLDSLPLPPPGKEKTLGQALASLDQTTAAGGDEGQAAAPLPPTGSFQWDLTVPGTTSWIDTGVDLLQGDAVEISATGALYWKKNSEESCDPNGVPGKGFWKPISRANTGALIGKIGADSYQYFVIGSQSTFQAGRAGRLVLGINDDNAMDNRGSYQVRVVVRR
jgi:Zn-dependent protease with chaperone function